MAHQKTAPEEILQELLLEDGEDFIDAAFKTLLNRYPDATGGQSYTRALRDGVSKLQILHDISMSSEYRQNGRQVVGLDAAFAREGLGVGGDTPWNVPTQVADITDAEKLLALAVDDNFIEMAYWVLLKRAPDKEGVANCRERFIDGATRLRVLCEMFNSSERQQKGTDLPGLREKFAAEDLPLVEMAKPDAPAALLHGAKSLDELQAAHGEKFVDLAYITLLGRVASDTERQQGIAELRTGRAKITLLGELAAAYPAVVAGARVPGLAAALRQHAWAEMPFLGRLYRFAFDVEGDSPSARLNRATALRLIEAEAEFNARLAELNDQVARIPALELRIRTSRESADARIVSLERSVAALRQLLRQVDENVRPKADVALELDLRSEEIARDLRSRP